MGMRAFQKGLSYNPIETRVARQIRMPVRLMTPRPDQIGATEANSPTLPP